MRGVPYASSASMAQVAGFSVPSCPSVSYWNSPRAGVVYGHSADGSLLVIVHPTTVTFATSPPDHRWTSLSVHGYSGYGAEYAAAGLTSFRGDRSYITWTEGDKAVMQLASRGLSLEQLEGEANNCLF